MAEDITLEDNEQEPRSLDILLTLDDSELRPCEIGIVIAERTRIAVRDAQHVEKLNAIKQATNALVKAERESNRHFEEMAVTLTELALERYRRASNG